MASVDGRAKELFLDALELEGAEREALLARECAADEGLRARLDELLAAHDDARRVLHTQSGSRDTPSAREPELTEGDRVGSYAIRAFLGEGGFGLVFLAEQQHPVRRLVALKIVKSGLGSPRAIARFEVERQTLASMEHPHIARVFDAGTTDTGRPYFVMEYVDGPAITDFCEREGLTLRERLELFRNVSLALQHAHQKGVIHRDIKPNNVLVGMVDGRPLPKVIDFGIAKAIESDAVRDSLQTREGMPMGTPAYMSPEQAEGSADIDTRSDVYSLGVLLYELLCGQPPLDETRFQGAALFGALRAIREEDFPPPSVRRRRDADTRAVPTSIPRELDWIVMRCLEKERSRRYPSANALAQDVERHLANEAIEAAPPGAWYRARKLVRRHRVAALLLASFTLALIVGAAGLGAGLLKARASERRADRERANVMRLSAMQELEDLQREAAALWPAHPERVPDYEAWLGRSAALLAGMEPDATTDAPGHRAQLTALRERATVADDGELVFPDEQTRWWHGQLERLVAELEVFSDPETGLIEGDAAEFGWGIERRLAFARSLRERSVDGPLAGDLWAEARDRIADLSVYEGLDLPPQMGLLPLDEDFESGLWEFAHLQTGAVPERDEEGRLVLDGETGLVFVLIPGGCFLMGAQSTDPARPGYDPLAKANEGPVHEVVLEPFFLSKCEMTQGQWLRIALSNPSGYQTGQMGTDPVGLANPVENVSWFDCERVLNQLGLELPTEAQWEYATRAGTTTPWWTGEDKFSLDGAANVTDKHALRMGATWRPLEEWLDDGHAVHARVGSYAPNPYGLFDVCGNVWEWCRDGFGHYVLPRAPGTGELLSQAATERLSRGGSFNQDILNTRSSARTLVNPDSRIDSLGLRPARAIVR